MQQSQVRHLLVLDQGRLAGILSIRDLIAVELDEKAEAINLLNAYVSDVPAHIQTHTQV
jgi:CBS domain-containing protein